jgi:hypothetical protein
VAFAGIAKPLTVPLTWKVFSVAAEAVVVVPVAFEAVDVVLADVLFIPPVVLEVVAAVVWADAWCRAARLGDTANTSTAAVSIAANVAYFVFIAKSQVSNAFNRFASILGR